MVAAVQGFATTLGVIWLGTLAVFATAGILSTLAHVAGQVFVDLWRIVR